MKGSFKSQLNYADIHQSPMLKCFFHKILKLLSAVTNCGSHNPRGLKEQARSLFLHDAPAKHHLIVPQSSQHTDPQERFSERARLQASQGLSCSSHLLLLTNVVPALIQTFRQLPFRLVNQVLGQKWELL